MDNDISLTPFSISPDCTPENKQMIQKIIKNVKINLFLDTKPITQHTLNKHHLSHYTPAICLTTYQLNKKYIFHLTDENNKSITQNNNNTEFSLEEIEPIFLHNHELKQDRDKITTITQATYKLLKDSTPCLKMIPETNNPSINETLRSHIKSFGSWLARIIEIRREINEETAIDILKIVSEILYLFWLENIEYFNNTRSLIGKAFKKEIPYLEKIELQHLCDQTHTSPYYESILQISLNSINYIKAKYKKVNIYDREQTGSLTMTTPKNITSTSTPKEILTVPSEKRKSTLIPDTNLSANLFTLKNNSRERLNDTDDESDSYPQVAMITDRNKKQKAQQNRIHFGLGNNNEYTYNPVIHNAANNHIATSSFKENQSTRLTEAIFNKLLKNMENKFNRMSENLQRRHEAQLNEAYDQIQHKIIEFNTQQNQRITITTQNR